MTDYTAAVIRLENAYESMKLARKRVADEIKARHRLEQRREIEEATREAEYEFAAALAREVSLGLPGNIIREEVLRTQDWSRWKKWRELANLEPERVVLANAKAERARAEAPFVWNDDYTVLTVRRDPSGTALPTPVDLDRWSMFAMAGKHWFMEGAGEENVALNNAYFREHKLAWAKMLDAEITKQFEAGNLADLPAKH